MGEIQVRFELIVLNLCVIVCVCVCVCVCVYVWVCSDWMLRCGM